jgi:hypothetical protein
MIKNNFIDINKVKNLIDSMMDYSKQIASLDNVTHHDMCHTHHLKCLLIRSADQMSLMLEEIQNNNFSKTDSDFERMMGWGKGKDE